MSDNLSQLRAAALADLSRNEAPAPWTWRVIITDSESPTGIAPVCTGERSDALHMIDDYPGGPKRDDEGVYDCCPWPQIDTYSTVWAEYLVALLNADGEGKVADHRAEVLAEVTKWLTKKAHEYWANRQHTKADTASVLASKVARGAVRPDNLQAGPASFFEPDRVYERPRWRFECHAVAPNPDDGQLRAIGFLQRIGGTATVIGLGRDNWADGWTPVETEGP